jgi:hypothetical protein
MASQKTLKDCKTEAHIAVLNAKVDGLVEEQKSLRERVRANERVVAIVSAIGIGVGGVGGTLLLGQQPANAGPIDGYVMLWVDQFKEWERRQNSNSPIDSLNIALDNIQSDTEQKEDLSIKDYDSMRIWNRIFRK